MQGRTTSETAGMSRAELETELERVQQIAVDRAMTIADLRMRLAHVERRLRLTGAPSA